MSDILYHEIGEDLRLAYRHRKGRGPTLIFLPGYRSDMEGAKANALDAWAEREGRAMLRFDYAGCGRSSGEFEAQSLHGWRGDVLAMIDEVADEGPVVLAGSSMGGWLMLLAALARPDRVAGLIGIAAAPDFTHWGFSQEAKIRILGEGRLETPNPLWRGAHGHHPHLLGERRGAAPAPWADRARLPGAPPPRPGRR